jgi:hypothetical protein
MEKEEGTGVWGEFLALEWGDGGEEGECYEYVLKYRFWIHINGN